MRALPAIVLGLALLAGMLPARAMDAVSQKEIDYLLHYVESSDARFIRNGSEYSAQEAAAHLRDKLQKAGNRVKTTEDFIQGIASKSYISGKPYLVRTATGEHPTGPWLSEALARYRQTKAKARYGKTK